MLTATPTVAAEHRALGTVTSLDSDLVRSEATVQVDENPLDRFKMIRLVQGHPAEISRGSVLLLPPAGFSFTFYELRYQPDFGHLDHCMSGQHQALVERPLLRWLRRAPR